MLEIGKFLKESREAKGLTLAEAEEATKIRKFYLSALESEDYQALPGQVYTIGFLRNYARFLGLDANLIVETFKRQGKDSSQPVRTPHKRKHRQHDEGKKGYFIEKHGWKAALVLLVAALAVYFAAQSGYFGLSHQPETSPPVNGVLSNPPSEAAAPEVAAPQPVEIKLELAAQGDCWTSVRADDQQVYTGTLHKGDKKLFTAKSKISFRLGNAGMVEVIKDSQSLGYLGGFGVVVDKEFVLDSE